MLKNDEMRFQYFFKLFTFLFFFLQGCGRDEAPGSPDDLLPNEVPLDEIIRIPVVVHVVNYSPQPFEINDEKIASQIEILNQDYRKRNPDWIKTPEEFISLVADVGLEFFLANTDPDGRATNGIIRTSGTVTGFDGVGIDGRPVENLALYSAALGGQDAWPNHRYLNIWIADLSDRHGNLKLAGYANGPGSDARIDGVVIDPRAFGREASPTSPYGLGRTATHEIGHWLNLRHVYGKDNSCEDGEDGDLVADTPVQYAQHTGSPVHPSASCGSNDMFMNFMDRVDDQSMYMFTNGQKQRMRALFNKDGLKRDLYLSIRK
jgi:hypothetical protein